MRFDAIPKMLKCCSYAVNNYANALITIQVYMVVWYQSNIFTIHYTYRGEATANTMGAYESTSFHFSLFCTVKYKKGIRNSCYCTTDSVYIAYAPIKFIPSFAPVYMHDTYIIKYTKIKSNSIP